MDLITLILTSCWQDEPLITSPCVRHPTFICCDFHAFDLTTCELASSGMTGLMEKNCDKLKWSKYGRSPQLRCNKKEKEKKRKIHNPINTHSFQKKLLSR
jgi:hypothetical protein